MEMKVSKVKAIIKYLTGGVAGIVEYILEVFNDAIAKLPAEEVAKYAQLAKDVANFVKNVANLLIKDEAKKKAALATADAFDELATSLLDTKITEAELDEIIDAVNAAVQAWKEAK